MNCREPLDCFNQRNSHTPQLVNQRMSSLSREGVKIIHSLFTLTLTYHTHVDGRGFAAQRKGAVLTSRDEVERGIFSGENEISSMQFAIVSIWVIRMC